MISQVYGGGGNSGATVYHDFVEIFNPTASAISLSGMSIQYASSTGTGNFGGSSSQITALSGTLAAGQYLLVQEGAGSGAGASLPTPDVTDLTPIAMSASAGKVALADTVTSLGCNGGSTPCSSSQLALIVDLVGYGTANFFEGAAAAPGLSNSTAAFRADGGCTDTDDNAADFSAAAPAPRNTASPVNPCNGGDATVIINEVDSDTPGTDAAEFVELFDGGAGSTVLDGLVVVFFNGSNDLSYNSFDLDGFSTDADGYFVLGNVAVSPTPNIVFADNGLQNGADAVALYAGDAGDFPNNTAVTTTGLVDAVVYDTSDADDAGLLVLLNAGQPQVNEDGAGDKDNDSIQRCPNGSGGARNTDSYAQFAPTPGASNICEIVVPPEVCGDPFTPIYDVQGNGASSPLAGSTVSTEGVVVGDFQNNASVDNGDLNGFHVQDPAGDGDAATSDGVFVYAPGGIDVETGDAVRVRGSVSEFNGMTEITSTEILICSTGNSVAATAVSLPVGAVDDFEPFEGMYVTFPQDLVIAEYFNFDRFGEIVLTSERHLTPTAEFEPGPAAIAAAADFLLDKITLDDGRTNQNPDPAIHPNGGVFDLTNLFRGGDTVGNVTGVLDYSFGLYRVQPTQGADYTNTNPRTAAPDPVGGNLTVASFNVLNYFTTMDYPTGIRRRHVWACTEPGVPGRRRRSTR